VPALYLKTNLTTIPPRLTIFTAVPWREFEVIVGCIRHVIEIGWPGVSYDTYIDNADGDDSDGFLGPVRPSFVPWMGRAVSEARAAIADGDHCREMAGRLRELARATQLAGMRRELVALADRYDRRGGHFDCRANR
jgi:hypothetical protein